jgi:hypothetical protein
MLPIRYNNSLNCTVTAQTRITENTQSFINVIINKDKNINLATLLDHPTQILCINFGNPKKMISFKVKKMQFAEES